MVSSDSDEVKMIVIKKYGFTLEMHEGSKGWEKICFENYPEITISLGEMVVADGGYGVSEGTKGIIVEINLPFENGKTSDILEVWFEGENGPMSMKFKDLNLTLKRKR